ncbi:MAG TPA: aminotransferase class I/II-fold pyridoxal phosphate-dependent enzyme [Candidatus Dormibacteraeota bacterium]|nr:aminotransferase class I/II-fold pyridoxal phosphate-dependent enzyme [Candidatus Dormibacteraeota bacterium]
MLRRPATTTLPLQAIASGPAEAAHSGIREVVNIALVTPGCIRLEVGEPNFPTPAHIVEAAVEFARKGQVKYTATAGLLSLRERLVAKLDQVNRIKAGVNNINCSVGGVGGIAGAIAALVDPGDEVLIPDPAWPNYRLMLAWAHGVLVPYTCPPERQFLPDPEEIERQITPRTKLIIINSPCNPTGAVFPRDLLERLVDLAVRHNLYLLSDECYDQVILDGEHLSPASFCTDGRVISAFTFSKTYAMTGWRVGYVVANDKISDSITKVLESNSSCLPTVCQKAAEAALDGPREPLNDMVKAYRERRDLCVGLLEEAGMLISRPQGAFYIMADVSRSGMDSRAFAFDLVSSKQVAVAPGTAFGESASQAVRISLASSPEDLSVGIGRMIERIEELS